MNDEPEISSADTEKRKLVRWLDSWSANKRRRAKQKLQPLNSVVLSELAIYLERKSNYARNFLFAGLLFGLPFVIIVMVVLLAYITGGLLTFLPQENGQTPIALLRLFAIIDALDSNARYFNAWSLFALLGAIASLFFLLACAHFSNHGLLELAKSPRIQNTGLYLEGKAYFAAGRESRTAVRAALLFLLPRLRFSDAALLNNYHYRCLRRIIKYQRKDTELTVAALKAIANIKDRQSLPMVKHLASDKASIPGAIRASAKECLLALQP